MFRSSHRPAACFIARSCVASRLAMPRLLAPSPLAPQQLSLQPLGVFRQICIIYNMIIEDSKDDCWKPLPSCIIYHIWYINMIKLYTVWSLHEKTPEEVPPKYIRALSSPRMGELTSTCPKDNIFSAVFCSWPLVASHSADGKKKKKKNICQATVRGSDRISDSWLYTNLSLRRSVNHPSLKDF